MKEINISEPQSEKKQVLWIESEKSVKSEEGRTRIEWSQDQYGQSHNSQRAPVLWGGACWCMDGGHVLWEVITGREDHQLESIAEAGKWKVENSGREKTT